MFSNPNANKGLNGKKRFSDAQIAAAKAVEVEGVLGRLGYHHTSAGWIKDGAEGITVRRDERGAAWCMKKSRQDGAGSVTLWMALTGQSFVDAVKSLTGEAGQLFSSFNPSPAAPAAKPVEFLPAGSMAMAYLAGRGIPAYIIDQAVTQGAVAEAAGSGGYRNTFLAHRDAEGVITGGETRNRQFKGFVGIKSLFQLRSGPEEVDLIVVTESAVDALSYVSIYSGSALVVSTGGHVGRRQRADLAALLTLHTGADLIAAQDADDAGDKQAGEVAAVAEVAGRLWVRHRPVGGKDWNELLIASNLTDM